jgi:hypothetical protein
MYVCVCMQGCNTLYYSQLGDIYYVTVQQTDEPRVDTVFNHTQYVTDIPLICNTLEPWCDYCNTTKYDHPVLPHPNYTCSFTTEVDLCTLDDNLLANETFCVNADINSTTATITTTEVASGRNLLKALKIDEIGERRVYTELCHQGLTYLGIYVLFSMLLNRKENHRVFSRRRSKQGEEKCER